MFVKPRVLLFQVLMNSSYGKVLVTISHSMQAQYQRRRPVQLAADVIENGMLTHSLASRTDEARLCFDHSWSWGMLAVATQLFYCVSLCSIMHVFLSACHVLIPLSRRLMERMH